MECEQLAVTVSWDQSALAQGYVAYVYDHSGHYVLMCEAEGTTTSCAVSGLMCGTRYDMWVVALGEEYNSSDSTTVTLTSGTDMHKGYKRNTSYDHKTTLYHFKSLFPDATL